MSASLLLALLAAALFGLVPHIQRAALPFTDVRTGAFITIATAAIMFWIIAPILVETGWWWTKATVIFALCGLFYPAVSQTLSLQAVAIVGPNLSSAIGSSAPLFAALFAVAFLGETLGAQGAAGMALLVGGLALAALRKGHGSVRTWAVWALLLPVGASFFRGIAQGITKIGYAEMPDPTAALLNSYFATLVMLSVSTVVLGAHFLRPEKRKSARQERRGNLLFAINGVVAGGGILALNAALSLGAVTLAAPLASTAPLWTLGYALVFFRTEKLTFRMLWVALIVVAGVALVVTR